MRPTDYTIVFKKLREATGKDLSLKLSSSADLDLDELEEIDELRRLAAQISEPEPTSYTST